MENWYNLNVNERIKNVFSKYTIEDFWNWWNDKENNVMEIRILNFDVIKEVAFKFNLSFCNSGVFINSSVQLKNTIAFIRDKATCWFGINPRKKNYNNKGIVKYRGTDNFVSCIKFLFVDIDRVNKLKEASNEELEKCDILSNKILERLSLQKWNESYIKICSGNGVQLVIKLDIPIKLPLCQYVFNKEKQEGYYIENEEFEVMRGLISNGIGKQILKFCRKYKDDLMVNVDRSTFKLSQVGAIPVTKNYKYDGFTWRGIIEMKDGKNDGLTDYILSVQDDLKTFHNKNVFTKSKLAGKYIIREGKLRENILIKFMLENDIPYGQINNMLWFQLKCLLRDSKFDLRSKEFILLHKELETKFKGNLTLNLPTNKFSFSENIVNSFCIQNGFQPIYELWPEKIKKLDMGLDSVNFNWKYVTDEVVELNVETDIIEDMLKIKQLLIEGNYLGNGNIIGRFINGCIKKYGEEKTKFYCNNLFRKYFNYS